MDGVRGTNGELVGSRDDLYELDLGFPSDSVRILLLYYSFFFFVFRSTVHARAEQDVSTGEMLVARRGNTTGQSARYRGAFDAASSDFVECARITLRTARMSEAVEYVASAGDKAQRALGESGGPRSLRGCPKRRSHR